MSKSSKTKRTDSLDVMGWREWLTLPDLDLDWIKAKVDTGARSSSLHAVDLEVVKKGGVDVVHFSVHPLQRSTAKTVRTHAKVLEYRSVRSSSGQSSKRPVILTTLTYCGESWPIELTLANRDEMGFRMLLGREGFRDKLLVDAGRSYYGPKPPAKRKKTKRKKAT